MMEEKLCAFCHAGCGMNKVRLKKSYRGTEYICYKCYEHTGIGDFSKVQKMTADELQPYIDEWNLSCELREDFKATDYVLGVVEADFKNRCWARLCGHLVNDAQVYSFSQTVSYGFTVGNRQYSRGEISVKDLQMQVSNAAKSRRAKCEKIQFAVETKSIICPRVEIDLLKEPSDFGSAAVNGALESLIGCIDMFERIIGLPDENEK